MKNMIISPETKSLIAKTYIPYVFNEFSDEQKTNFVISTFNQLCIDNNLPEIIGDNIDFLEIKGNIKASFVIPDKIAINDKLLNYDINENIFNLQTANQVSYCLLLNLVHEFRHYQQYCENKDLDNEIIKGLKAPLSGTDLYLFQEHEKDAFVTTFKATDTLKNLFDNDFIDYINYEVTDYNRRLEEDKASLKANGYSNPEALIKKVRPFYDKYLSITENNKLEKLEFEYNQNYYKLNLNKQNNNWQGKLSLDKVATESNLYFEINKNNLEILNVFDANKVGVSNTVQTDLDNKKLLTDTIIRIVALSQNEFNLTPKDIKVNPMPICDNKYDVENFKKIFKNIENIKINGIFNKSYEIIYPIKDKLTNSINEYKLLNSTKDMLNKIIGNTATSTDINKNLLNEVCKMVNNTKPFNFNSLSENQIINLFKEELKDGKYKDNLGNYTELNTNDVKGMFYNTNLNKLINQTVNKILIDDTQILNNKDNDIAKQQERFNNLDERHNNNFDIDDNSDR